VVPIAPRNDSIHAGAPFPAVVDDHDGNHSEAGEHHASERGGLRRETLVVRQPAMAHALFAKQEAAGLTKGADERQ